MEGPEAAAVLGAELLAADQDLSQTSPISLALLCDAAVEASNDEMMGQLYDYFKENFEDSDDIWRAHRAKTFQLMGQENFGAALKVIDEVQGLFGPVPHMGWAQLAKGDCLYKMGEYEEAENAYNAVMGVSEWRGPIFAKAYIGMALCRIGRSDYETAHSFYQRTYLLFKSYDDGTWAADGYLGAAECLNLLGRDEDAVNTLNEMLEDTYVNTLPQADRARELKKKYGGAK
jgi:tetratricopeptide (TPR) repeat protein